MKSGRSLARFLGTLVMALGPQALGLATEPASATGVRPSATAAGSGGAASFAVGGESVAPAPRINRKMSSRLSSTLESAFSLAVERVQNKPQCRAIFADLGADGVTVLSSTLYYQASLKMEKQVCPRAFGYTLVGGAPTWVCQQFAQLNDRRAARVLLHEALHHGGLDERPHDPDGPTPADIDELVSDACDF